MRKEIRVERSYFLFFIEVVGVVVLFCGFVGCYLYNKIRFEIWVNSF